MNPMRERAKEQFPMVLLTLLSIVQALALELLWSYVREADYLFEPGMNAAVSWLQVSATLLGLVLIWVVYAGNMMRFRWVPVTSDSVYPFLIGVLEFMLVEAMGPGRVGAWLMLLGIVFGVMVVVTHKGMRRARRDGDNAAFFAKFEPARPRDFIPQFAIVAVLAIAGLVLVWKPEQQLVAALALLATNAMLAWQFYEAASFWRRSVTEEFDESSSER